jgi:hypothetical protein
VVKRHEKSARNTALPSRVVQGSSQELRRYTSLASALDILAKEALTLLPPSSWDDKNDAFVMEHYRARANLNSVLALCFAASTETYHHWRMFAPGPDGICLVFNRAKLQSNLAKREGVRARMVKYRSLKSIKQTPPTDDLLPFTKRSGFHAEKEFRIICEAREKGVIGHRVDIDMSALVRVVVNPWLPKPLFDVVKEALVSASGSDVVVKRSTLTNSSEFQRALGALET